MKLIAAQFYAKPGLRQDLLDAARHHQEETRKEEGCMFFHLVPMPDNPDGLLLTEGFVSEEAHRRHADTERMRALLDMWPRLLARVDYYALAGEGTIEHETF